MHMCCEEHDASEHAPTAQSRENSGTVGWILRGEHLSFPHYPPHLYSLCSLTPLTLSSSCILNPLFVPQYPLPFLCSLQPHPISAPRRPFRWAIEPWRDSPAGKVTRAGSCQNPLWPLKALTTQEAHHRTQFPENTHVMYFTT